MMNKIPEDVEISINANHVVRANFSEQDFLALYTAIWQNMERENALINFRISWALWITASFIAAQGFIAGSLLQYGSAPGTLVLHSSACFFMAAMSLAAVYGSWRVKEAVDAAITQLSYLKYFYLHSKGGGQNLFENFLHLPRPFGDPAMHKSGNKAAKTFAPALITLWTVLTVIELAAGMLFLTKHLQHLGI